MDVIWVSEVEEEVAETEKLPEEIMTTNFPKLVKDINL